MILWTIKLISSVRKAIAGRQHPGQLAWGVALGALLGMIPHGNLLAIGLLLFVLLLQINHAMMALVGVAVTFLAPQLDPTFDALGRWVFAQPQIADRLSLAWQYPLVPWTDLNNTIVMGSFLIGLTAVGPLYLISYPLFRAWAPVDTDSDDAESDSDSVAPASDTIAQDISSDTEIEQPVHRFDPSHVARDVSLSGKSGKSGGIVPVAISADSLETPPQQSQPVAAAETTQPTPQPPETQAAPRTSRIAIGKLKSGPVLRSKNVDNTRPAPIKTAVDSQGSPVDEQHKIDEALSYLLRQLRDSKDKDAA